MIGKIADKKEIAAGTLRVVFEVNEPFEFKAGQYCVVTLRGEKRFFSIVNSPNQKGIMIITTRLSGSGFKRTLKEMPVGSKVELGPIGGNFTLPENTTKPLIFIAGGIGITPFMSILTYVSEEKLSYKITLLYSNRDRSSTAYLAELQNLKSQMSNLKLIFTVTEDPAWKSEKRKIDSSFIKEYLPNLNANFYMIVGAPAMVFAVEKALLDAGVSPENIKKENFTGY